MNDIERQIEEQLTIFRKWCAGRRFETARLVQYCGHECGGGMDITVREAESQIAGCLSEGFRVDWNEKDRTLYLCVSESVDHPLDWEKVFAEQHLSDIDAALREADFNPDDVDGISNV